MATLWYSHFDSTPEDTRLLLAEDWAKYIRNFLGDGIKNGGTNLQISADGQGMYVNMSEGYANIQGYFFKCEEDYEGAQYKIDYPAANASNARIDRVVLRLDRTIAARNILPMVLIGEPGTEQPPELTRTSNIWEISLARVRVPAGAAVIYPAYITDERLNPQVCGIIDSLISADTEELYYDFHAKFEVLINDFIARYNELIENQNKNYQEHYNRVVKWFDEQSAEILKWFKKIQEETAETFEALMKEFRDYFNNQMMEQDRLFNEQRNTIQYWYEGVKTDIARLQTFNFDNILELPGTTRETIPLSGGGINETITKNYDGTLVAERQTKVSGEKVSSDFILYDEDGKTILKKRNVDISLENGKITEKVSDTFIFGEI